MLFGRRQPQADLASNRSRVQRFQNEIGIQGDKEGFIK